MATLREFHDKLYMFTLTQLRDLFVKLITDAGFTEIETVSIEDRTVYVHAVRGEDSQPMLCQLNYDDVRTNDKLIELANRIKEGEHGIIFTLGRFTNDVADFAMDNGYADYIMPMNGEVFLEMLFDEGLLECLCDQPF